ncbi:hypothetical protein MY1884_004301 [Beauveria asiatica]
MESELPPPPYDSCVLKNKGADILVQNAYKNQIWSPLLRLPDKTLIALMKSLDLDSLLLFRHTSRIFMWLFSSDAGFKQYHLTPREDKDRFDDTARIWTPPSSWFKNQAASPFRAMCQQCATTRKGHVFGKALLKSMPELYCSRCHTKHRSMHFSRGQRLLPEKKKPRGMSTTSWMPVSWPVAGNPLRIFDPNLCDCVEWRGSSPEAKRMRWPICPDPARPWRSAADEKFYVSTEPRCSKHVHNIVASFTDAKAEIWVLPCQARPVAPAGKTWSIIDHTTWSLTTKCEELLGVLTKPAPCQTYSEAISTFGTWNQETAWVQNGHVNFYALEDI